MNRNRFLPIFLMVFLIFALTACLNNDEQADQGENQGDTNTAEVQPVAQTDDTPEEQGDDQAAEQTDEQPAEQTDDSSESQTDEGSADQAEQQTDEQTEDTATQTDEESDTSQQQVDDAITTQHTVQEREWLTQIARCYGSPVQDVIAANNVTHPGWIMAGEVWTIPNVGTVSTAVGPPCLIFYTVQTGDTLTSIAQAYQIPLDMLVFANYGCYGYNAHYDYYAPPVPELYDDAVQLPSYPVSHQGCYYYSYPTIHPGDMLVIPVTADNAAMR